MWMADQGRRIRELPVYQAVRRPALVARAESVLRCGGCNMMKYVLVGVAFLLAVTAAFYAGVFTGRAKPEVPRGPASPGGRALDLPRLERIDAVGRPRGLPGGAHNA